MNFSMKMMWACVAVVAIVAILAVAGGSVAFAFAIPCVLMMGAMMWMMMRGMGGVARRGRSASSGERDLDEPLATGESPMEILERRFAAGAIPVEEYRARREALVNGAAQQSVAHKDELLTVPRGDGR
jgi:uncharacterized membrane protein